MMKLPSAPDGGSVPSASSVAFTKLGFEGFRVGGTVLKSSPVVSMKKGAPGLVVLAPWGTAPLFGTQVGCASAEEESHTSDSIAPDSTVDFFMFDARSWQLLACL